MKHLKLYEHTIPWNSPYITIACDKYRIKNYIINRDGTINVNDNVSFNHYKIYCTSLPLRFNKVEGYFDCSHNDLISLEGCPTEVKRYFDCSYNRLGSLEGAPKEVGGHFDCSNNNLINLKGGPKKIDYSYICSDNNLQNLIGAPKEVGGEFD